MEKNDALLALAALGQETRLDVFRLLVRAGRDGATAGAIAEKLQVRSNTLSTHLGALVRAGLVVSRPEGRSIQFFARMDGMQELVTFLLEDCCNGRPDLCSPIADLAASCAANSQTTSKLKS